MSTTFDPKNYREEITEVKKRLNLFKLPFIIWKLNMIKRKNALGKAIFQGYPERIKTLSYGRCISAWFKDREALYEVITYEMVRPNFWI